MDEGSGTSAFDSSANGNTLTLAGGPAWVAGKFGTALNFNGSSQSATKTSATGLPAANAAQSISAWFFYTSAQTGASGQTSIIVLRNAGNTSLIRVGFCAPCGGQVRINNSAGAIGGTPSLVPSNNTWHLYTYTYDGTTHSIYIDGSLLSSNTAAADTGSPTIVDIAVDPSGNLFKGNLDDVRIYSGALSAAQVSALYANGLSVKSVATGNWSNPATWDVALVPTSQSTVTISAGNTVTVDITTATASTTTVNGTLSFSRVAGSSLTLVNGDMIVNSGGTLDMGTEASPIPSSFQAALILASGSSPVQYGLVVNSGGVMTMRGATKDNWTTATADALAGATTLTVNTSSTTGWQAGDIVAVSQTDQSSTKQTEFRSVVSLIGNTLTLGAYNGVGPGLAYNHHANSQITVVNTTRNAVVKSSSSVDPGYILNQTPTESNFQLRYAELSGLGWSTAPDTAGLSFKAGSRGTIAYSSVHNNYYGITLQSSSVTITQNAIFLSTSVGFMSDPAGVGISSISLIGNAIFSNGTSGAELFSTDNLIAGNVAFSNGVSGSGDSGIIAFGQRNIIRANRSYANTAYGITLNPLASRSLVDSNLTYNNNNSGLAPGGNGNTYVGNISSGNQRGMFLGSGGGSLFVGNTLNGNNQNGIFGDNTNNSFFIGNFIYNNGTEGISLLTNTTSNIVAEGTLGYDASGNSSPDATTEISLAAGSTHNMTLKKMRINPVTNLTLNALNIAGNYLLSFNQDFATGTVRVWGDYLLSGSTWTLDNNSQIYPSTASAPKPMIGVGHSATLCSTNDTNAVSQLVRIQRTGGVWQVTGSSSGLMGIISTFGGSCPGTAFPATNAQVNLVFTQGASPQDGDNVDFALIAASGDSGVQKKLLFGPAASGFNQGRSRLTVDPTGGLVLRGIAGTNALVDMLPGGTYYTLIDSGAFTSSYSSFTNLDSGGLQLAGSAGVSIDNTVFDFMGIAAATNTYVTARSLTSNFVFNNISFLNSRSTAAPHAYNVKVEGSDAGLSWTFNAPPSGNLWGAAFDFDPNSRITWGASNLPPTNPVLSQSFISSITVTFGNVGSNGYEVDASSVSDFSGALLSSSTIGAITALSPQNLTPNTTYYARAGALWGSATFYANTSPAFAVTLAAAPSPLTVTGVTGGQFTVNWPSNGNPSSTVYEVGISTDVGFSILTSSLSTTSLSATFNLLTPNVSYFIRARAINLKGIPSVYILGVAVTAGGLVTISANRLALPGVWYNIPSAIFFAQGASTYHYKLTSNAADIPGLGDPTFGGSGLNLALFSGGNYFHVLGLDGSGNPVGVAHFGPINIDVGSPVIVSVSAQANASDPTPIVNGGTTISLLPRFTWTAATSLSPIVGYSVSVSTDAAVQPPSSISTTLTFLDQSLTAPGQYFVKVAALNLAGTTGPAAGMTFTLSNVPAADALVLKKNRFNPLRGECSKIDVQAATGGHLKIELYTLLGQRVSTLVNQDVSPGIYSYSWCGATQSGELAASGIYLLRVEAPAQKTTYKIAVTK